MVQQLAEAPNPAQVAAKVRELDALEVKDATSFAELLADNLMEPDPVEVAAFRSDALAWKSLTATKYLIDRTNEQIRRHRANSDRQRGSIAFRNKVVREQRVLQQIVDGLRAKNGILPNLPNPKRRAQIRLWNLAMTNQPIAPGTWRVLLEEEKEKDAQRKRDAKKARRDARREERA